LFAVCCLRATSASLVPSPPVLLLCCNAAHIDLQAEDFDEGVVHQLNAKRSEEEAVAAVRHIAHYDLANIQHMAAYLNHLVKHYNHSAAAAAAAAAAEGIAHGAAGLAGLTTAGSGGGVRAGSAGGISGGGQLLATGSSSLGSTLGSSRGGSGGGVPASAAAAAAGGNLGAFGGQIRLASVPVSTKSMLQKLPLKVFRQLEQLVAGCAYLEWRHFDAGVVKVGPGWMNAAAAENWCTPQLRNALCTLWLG
jgi:hypothetical protein